VVNTLLGLDREVAAQTIDQFFGRKDPKVQEDNRQALEKSIEWAKTIENKTLKLAPVTAREKMLMLSGNECLALGALAAGLKFYSFYPMTPATGIGQTLAALAEKTGIIVEQGEDEIAVLNMALGASFAGAPSMVATSGGGFALMVEAVSLAGMTETPIVIVVGQRPAPATGLPTRTEQADLEFVLHAAHGEFPRAVFAPGTVEDCFFIPGRALALAEKYQSPIFILTDQFVADSYRSVKPFELKDLTPVRPGAEENAIAQPYRRYAITESGISPRLLPGMSKHLVVADSDEHTEDGHLTEDLSVRKQMVEKRLRKLEGMRREIIPPEFIGDPDPDLLLVCWGSTKGSALEAAGDLRPGGRRVGVLHFTQVWPLAQEQFMERLQKAKQVICVESNAQGQFARLLRRETGFEIKQRILRYDGLPITPEYILREMKGSR
jgi:2-oxoglutarate ferredoxin oxidoreductase subunit alpha